MGGAIIDIRQYDEKRLQVNSRSRRLGQDWQFDVRVSAAVVDGGMLAETTGRPKVVEPAPSTAEPGGPNTRRRALARLGYEFKEDEFLRAIEDGTIAAVDLFVELGMKGTAVHRDGTPAIVVAATACNDEPKEPRPQVIASLLRAGANPNSKDSNNATALIWAAQGCSADAVRMLLAAGADVNARAKGGGTALTTAQALKRSEIIAVLEAAGAR
jgi:hypothetical protein